MWLIIVLMLTILFVGISLWRTPQVGLAVVVPLTWLFPVWLMLPLFETSGDSIVGTGVDVKVAVSAASLILYCFLPGRTFPLQPTFCDAAVAMLIAVHLCSDFQHEGFSWMILGRAYAEWYLPYVCGRLALQSRSDVTAAWPVIAAVACTLGLLGIVEATTGINVFDWIFGARPEEGFRRDSSRWGIKRAYGPTMHAIYFGVVQLVLSGWVVFAGIRAWKRRASPWWMLAPAAVLLGVVSTASRGPVIGLAAASLGGAFLGFPKWRASICIGLVALLLAAVAYRKPLIELAAQWAGEATPSEVLVDGQKQEQSSIRNRINIFAVYRIAIRRAEMLGFGTKATHGFPINVPLGPHEVETIRSVKYIDNAYVLLTLRFGYLGALAFILAAIGCWAQFQFIADRYRGKSPSLLAMCLGAATTGVLVVLLTVWMPHEISFPLMWTFGVSSGLMVAHWNQALE